MSNHLFRISVLLFLLACSSSPVGAQPVFFRRLGIKDGLNATGFWHAAIDKYGFIWIASLDGLFLYDGYSVEHFTKETHPQLPSNIVNNLFCDSRNRVWIQTDLGVAMIDQNRRLTRIDIRGYPVKGGIDRMVFEAPGKGFIAITSSGSFVSTDGISHWKPYPWLNAVLNNSGAVDIRLFDQNTQLLSLRNKKILLINFKEEKIVLDYPLPGVLGACRLNSDEVLAGTDGQWGLHRISVKENRIIESYPAPVNTTGKSLKSGVVMMDKAADGNIYISTRREGLVRFNPNTGHFDHFTHDPFDEHSLITNGLRMVTTNDKGMLVVTSPTGVHFTNVNYSVMNHQLSFRDVRDKTVDEPVNAVVTDRMNNIYLTTSNKVLKWNRASQQTRILRDISNEVSAGSSVPVPSCIAIDNSGNVWVGFNGDGIIIYDSNGAVIRHLKKESSLPVNSIRAIRLLGNGRMMAGAENKLFMIDPATYAIDSFKVDTPLQQLSSSRILDVLPGRSDVWIAVSPNGGVFHYDFLTRKLVKYDQKNGLGSDRVYCLSKDAAGTVYAGTRAGLSIIDRSGKITNLDKSNGLLNSRIESIETDDSGFIWFTNTNKITRYDPRRQELTSFGESNGISNTGFGVVSSHKSRTGELFFGTSTGLLFFHPRQIRQYKEPVQLYIHQTIDGKHFMLCNKDSLLDFAYKEGKAIFQVSASDIFNNQQLYYRYKLEGLDTGWSQPTHTRSIAYNLRPGNYKFSVQASYDRINYFVVSDAIPIYVAKPFWQAPLFIVSSVVAIACVTGFLIHRRFQILKRETAIQQQMHELEAKALRAQMNPHFIFNSLNAIQECIVTEKTEAAYEYLSKFSRLLRLVLNASETNVITLSDELEMIRLYLSLESLRFAQSFSFSIAVDPIIDTDEITVPSLLIQPFIENALWHGLRFMDGEKKLMLRFKLMDHQLHIEIEDNGIGRERAAAIKSQKLGTGQYASKGTVLSQQRISLLHRMGVSTAQVEIIDKVTGGMNSAGTKVIIRLPVQDTVIP